MTRGRFTATAALFAVAALVIPASQATADHAPADKVVAGGSTLEVSDAQSGPVELLSATLRSSTPTDLVLSVTAECALWTDVATQGNDHSQSIARVEIWVELDGKVVKVSSDDTATGDSGAPMEVGQAEAGRVVFCNRAFALTTTDFDNEDAMIQIFNRTRHANAFNWLTLNVGSGIHEVKVFGKLTTDFTENAFAKAVIGKRTLIVEPTKLANDATI